MREILCFVLLNVSLLFVRTIAAQDANGPCRMKHQQQRIEWQPREIAPMDAQRETY